ncbi:MAG: hypothetical protein FJ104_10940, partial [Deltaproteobacteria bacterium]|nr:hypothetical protein [Deltaproteobacteria bacterium]
MPQTDTTPTPADDTRSNAAKLLEQLLAILRGNAEGITDSFGVRILASAVARALDAYERCEMRPAPAAAGIAPMPDHLLPSELDALIRERFGGTPDGKPGAGRIRIQDWASRAVTSPPPAESDGALDPAIIDSANQLSFAVRLFQCAVGDAAVLAALTASLRAARPTAAAEGAIRGVEAILARGTP